MTGMDITLRDQKVVEDISRHRLKTLYERKQLNIVGIIINLNEWDPWAPYLLIFYYRT